MTEIKNWHLHLNDRGVTVGGHDGNHFDTIAYFESGAVHVEDGIPNSAVEAATKYALKELGERYAALRELNSRIRNLENMRALLMLEVERLDGHLPGSDKRAEQQRV